MEADGPAARGCLLGDGAFSCSHADLPHIYDSVNAFLDRHRIDDDACIAVQGRNTLPSALAILSLLARGTGFALAGPNGPSPEFCRYSIDCEGTAGSSRQIAAEWNIADTLRLRDNLSWQGAVEDYRGRVYVRTSGSTSAAKMVMFTHAKLWANARSCVARFQLTACDRIAIPVPLHHMYGFAAALLPAVLASAAIDIQADSNVVRYLQRESEFAPTTVFLTPGFCYGLVRLHQARGRYRLTVSAGDRTPPDIFRRYEDVHGCLVSLYGSTELGAVASGAPSDTADLRCGSTGRPMPGVVVGTVKTDEGDVARGELCFDHAAGGEGYADDRGRVIEGDTRFFGGRLKSRDVGWLGEDGYLRVLGRSDHMIKRDGRLVAFAEVEAALMKNELIEAAVVLSDGLTARGARLTAVCVVRGRAADARGLRDATRQHLPAYAVPDRVVLIADIPRLESGKPDRASLTQFVAGSSS